MNKTATHPTIISIDHNGQLPVAVEQGKDGAVFSIDLAQLSKPDRLVSQSGHFRNGMGFETADGQEITCTVRYDNTTRKLAFHADELAADASPITLKLYGQPILTLLHSKDGGWSMDPAHALERLTVDEIRELADYEVRPEKIPHDRALLAEFDPKKHASVTDLHTHSSAQVSAAELMKMALDHKILYPTELFKKFIPEIVLNDQEAAAVQENGARGIRFSPCEHERLKCEQDDVACDGIPLSALTPEHRQQIERQLCVAQDQILCFSDFDRQYYRFVNPIVKNADVTRSMILKIAEDYATNGVKYAELSTASMLNLDKDKQARWFSEMSDAVAEAEEKTGVKLRFLIGLPRNYDQAKAMVELEKIKHAARHPLIAGVDLLGYEFNRTSDFSTTLGHIAEWASAPEGTDLNPKDGWDFKRDFVIRIHAGETGKNSGNVAAAVALAKKYGVRVRIAHAVNEKLDPTLDRDIKALSSMHPPLVEMEFCAPSNIAYNNIQSVSDVPYRRWLACADSWYLGTDGGGAIQTTPTQMAIAGIYGGIKVEHLNNLRANEERYIADEAIQFDAKKAAFEKMYGTGKEGEQKFFKEFSSHVKEVNTRNAYLKQFTPPVLPPTIFEDACNSLHPSFAGKTPIMIAGASGESFGAIPLKTQLEVRRAMHMLVASCDPKKTYFVVGRTKNAGVTAALDEAVLEYNKQHPTNKFQVLGLITGDMQDHARSVCDFIKLPGAIDQVPDNLVRFMQHQKDKGHEGVSIFIGGSNYTADMIRKSKEAELPFLVMKNAPGASKQFSKKLSSHRLFDSALNLVEALSGEVQRIEADIFKPEVDPHALEQSAKERYPTVTPRFTINTNGPKPAFFRQ
jgi:adenosine deaminase